MDNIILKNKYYRVFFAGLLVILVFPLLNIQPWLSPPAWGKTVLFRILFSILLYFLFYLIFSRKDGENLKPYFKTVLTDRFNPLFWPFWLLISLTGLYILATVFSLDPHYSFWGSPQRAGGSLNFILYILFSFFAFIIVKGKDWSRVWNFVFIVAGIESLISIFQKAGTFSSILIPRTEQVIGTMGSSILLGLFLLIPFFMALAFAIRAHGKKKIFYLACLFLYFAAIILTASRAAIMGLFWGTLFFIFTYPSKTKKLKSAKISLIVLILAGIAFAFWLNAKPALVESFKANSVLGIPFTRVWNTARPFLDVKNISFEKVATDSRFSGWKVLYPAVKERPLFGFGPENVSIAFDKYYEPLLPGFRLHDWWDKAHNFALDMAVGAGVPALAVYLSFLGVLFWRLRKLKGALSQGIQSAFAAYLTADFFGFDAFSTYLVFFLGVGFAFSLIAKKDIVPVLSRRSYNLPLWKSGFSFVLFCLLLLFIWNAGLKPLKMNKELNMADYYARADKCEKSYEIMDELLQKNSILDNYLRLSYVDIIGSCFISERNKLAKTPRLIEVLREAAKSRPYYTRAWMFLGDSLNYLIYQKRNDGLIEEAKASFEKALQLSPKRYNIMNDLSTTYLFDEEYDKAVEYAQKCLEINPEEKYCIFNIILADIAQGRLEKAERGLKDARKYGLLIEEEYLKLNQIAGFYSIASKNAGSEEEKEKIYKLLIETYKALLKFGKEDEHQHHASLAFLYKEMKQYDKAKEEAIIVLGIQPEAVVNIEEFLNTMPNDPGFYSRLLQKYKDLVKEFPEKSDYHGSLAFLYKILGYKEDARKEALKVLELRPEMRPNVAEFIKSL